ncbi:hypothetical protein [Flavobacterium sp.]|uniref:hypothetical protein n=1 Tax=Flavobacterium sp. TaxID=239 RepID=UPI0037528E2B
MRNEKKREEIRKEKEREDKHENKNNDRVFSNIICVLGERGREREKEREKEKAIVPTIESVKTYFLEQNFPELEAIKFFNYFSSNGWLVGGKTPMVNWQAAAQNWILNAPKFISNEQQPNRAKHLNTGTDKDYSEPL